jgi:hypothetical protein
LKEVASSLISLNNCPLGGALDLRWSWHAWHSIVFAACPTIRSRATPLSLRVGGLMESGSILIQFDDVLRDEDNEGLDKCTFLAQSRREQIVWAMLGNAVAYTGFHAYQGIGRDPGPTVSEIDESCLDPIDEELRCVSPHFGNIVAQAAEYLKDDPVISFAQLRTKLSRDFVEDMGTPNEGVAGER